MRSQAGGKRTDGSGLLTTRSFYFVKNASEKTMTNLGKKVHKIMIIRTKLKTRQVESSAMKVWNSRAAMMKFPGLLMEP